jgi:hypothetical protein
VWLSVGPVATLGFSPGGDVGLALEGGFSVERFALSMGARADLPVTTARPSAVGSANTWLAQAALAVCWRSWGGSRERASASTFRGAMPPGL